MQNYTKTDIYNKIQETAEKSVVLRGRTTTGRWTVNELIYCLELINVHEFGDVTLSIYNTTSNECIPIGSIVPVWVNVNTRSKLVEIEDVIIEEYEKDKGGDEEHLPETCYSYIITVKEVG